MLVSCGFACDEEASEAGILRFCIAKELFLRLSGDITEDVQQVCGLPRRNRFHG